MAAGVIALILLALFRDRFPREHVGSLLVSGLCGMVGYPVFTTLGLMHAPAAHAVVIVGFMPSLTAVFAALRGGERPSPGFWLACAAGACSVAVFAISTGAGHLQIDDIYFMIAAAVGSYGYAEGAVTAKAIGGVRVVFWGQALLLPLTIPALFWTLHQTGLPHVTSPVAWIAFADLVFFSALIGFFLWYMGLSRGGIARVGQVQLLQLPLSCLWCTLFLGERLDSATLIAAAAIVLSALASMLTRRKPIVATAVRPEFASATS